MKQYENDKEFKKWLLDNAYANLDLKNHQRNNMRIEGINLNKTYKAFKDGKPEVFYKS